MNSIRLIYILQSEFIFSIVLYIVFLIIDLIFSVFIPSKEVNFLSNILHCVFLSSFLSVLLSINKKVVVRFLEIRYNRFNSTMNSIYLILIHFIFLNLYLIFDSSIEVKNTGYLYIIILLIVIYISNLKFTKIINEK